MSDLHIPDTYLGDGVYASFDGWHIWLDLRAQDSTTRIALDPHVLKRLDDYRHHISGMVMEHRHNAEANSAADSDADGAD